MESRQEANQVLKDCWPILVCQARRLKRTAALDHDDLVNEGALGAYRALRAFDPSRGLPLGAWLALCSRRAMIDAMRTRNGTRRRHRISMSPTDLDSEPDRRSDCDLEAVEARDEAARLRHGLGWLERLVVVLYWIEGWTDREIGAVLGRAASGVCRIRNDAFDRMRQKAREA